MVLDAGKIVEFDSPSVLFEKKGHFYGLAKEAGISSMQYSVLWTRKQCLNWAVNWTLKWEAAVIIVFIDAFVTVSKEEV